MAELFLHPGDLGSVLERDPCEGVPELAVCSPGFPGPSRRRLGCDRQTLTCHGLLGVSVRQRWPTTSDQQERQQHAA
jgi:hypothetical protein